MNKTVVSLALLLTLLISDKKLIPILSQQQDDQTAECLFGDSSPPRLQQRCASNTPSGSNLFGSPAFLSAPAVPAPAAGGGMKGSQSLIPVVQLGLPTFQQLFRTPALPQPAAAALSLAIPPLESCKIGQRFIANHIVYICHQYRTDLRGFRPFACAVKNQLDTKFISRNATYNNQNFRYKCVDSGGPILTYKALNCLLNEIHIRPGESLRRGQTEFTCIRDDEGMLKIVEKTMLHEHCLPGNRNDSLLDGGRCPGISVQAIFADFGSGSEVIFDTKRLVLISPEQLYADAAASGDFTDNEPAGGGEEASAGGKAASRKSSQNRYMMTLLPPSSTTTTTTATGGNKPSTTKKTKGGGGGTRSTTPKQPSAAAADDDQDQPCDKEDDDDDDEDDKKENSSREEALKKSGGGNKKKVDPKN